MHSDTGSPQIETKRIVGIALLLLGSVLLPFAICILGSLGWLGLPRTTSIDRTLGFVIAGLVVGLSGYRLVSGSWSGSLQVPHRAAALGGLLFLGYAAKAMLLSKPQPHAPPLWMLAIAGFAVISWCFVGRYKRG